MNFNFKYVFILLKLGIDLMTDFQFQNFFIEATCMQLTETYKRGWANCLPFF